MGQRGSIPVTRNGLGAPTSVWHDPSLTRRLSNDFYADAAPHARMYPSPTSGQRAYPSPTFGQQPFPSQAAASPRTRPTAQQSPTYHQQMFSPGNVAPRVPPPQKAPSPSRPTRPPPIPQPRSGHGPAAIPAANFEKYFDDLQATPGRLKEKYEAIPKKTQESCDSATETGHVVKNRYRNIIPYDSSRVVLPSLEGRADSDYINASFITGYNNQPRCYIAAQGPKPETIGDFWRMIVAYDVTKIVMVTTCRENMKSLCEEYWPAEVGQRRVFDMVVVKTESIKRTAHYVIRDLMVNWKGKLTMLRQYQMTSWVDKSKPDSTLPMLDMMGRVRAEGKPGPLLVHCSAGVGRTGTYIALDLLLDQLRSERQLDVDGTVHRLRKERQSMVQTLVQYVFIHDFLVTFLKLNWTSMRLSRLTSASQRAALESDIERQYKSMQTVTRRSGSTQNVEDLAGSSPENAEKNRLPNVIPGDRFRAYLNLPSPGCNDYINAVYLHSFANLNKLIVTQIPLPDTVVDFWRLLHDHSVSTVVLLEDMSALFQSIPEYWPSQDQQSCVYGPLSVRLQAVNALPQNGNIFVWEFAVTRQRRGQQRLVAEEGAQHVRFYQLTSWPYGEAVPPNITDFLDLVTTLNQVLQDPDSGKVVVQCFDGVTRCGIFCAACHVLGQAELWSDVDVPLAVLSQRERRPEFVGYLDQFRYLFELVAVRRQITAAASRDTPSAMYTPSDTYEWMNPYGESLYANDPRDRHSRRRSRQSRDLQITESAYANVYNVPETSC